MAAARDLKPGSRLRRVGLVGLFAGLIFQAIAVGGWLLFSSDGQGPGAAEALAMALTGAIGLLIVLVAVSAFTAASRFPVIAHMAGPNDFLAFLAFALIGAGSVALIIMGSAALAILPFAAAGPFIILSSSVRRVCRSPEAQAPADA